MRTQIQQFDGILKVVELFSKQLYLDKLLQKQNPQGRKLAIPPKKIIALALFKHKNGIETKKAVYEIFNLNCSYKTLVVNMNHLAQISALILIAIMKLNRSNAHPVKYIDSTDIPVCLFKNAKRHKTMKKFADFRKCPKGTFYGLKMHLLVDLSQNFLGIKFTSAKTDDREMIFPLAGNLSGIFIGDAGYISKKLKENFDQEYYRIFVAKPRKNMKKIMSKYQENLYRLRFLIEFNFRNLKMFHGLVTSLPRSINGYLANYIYALLAYQIA
ncbi:MAG: IS982 family transposase [Candidatus Moranbacteria bacterium]|nr:IS982 family transposase [Candidatus Moranbacteria bacterium]